METEATLVGRSARKIRPELTVSPGPISRTEVIRAFRVMTGMGCRSSRR